MTGDVVRAVDLFCGAGGFSTGLALACEDLDRDVELVAINHWDRAIETHERNHPWATHHHSKIEELHPPDVVDGPVDILVAGPECTHFSNARGGKPVNEQRRASPWHVVDWLEKLDVSAFVVENVRELESWGPVDEDGQPTRNGEVFDAWINSLHALGYSVDWRVLNAADYGDPTSRERLFVLGQRGNRASWPSPTHSEDGDGPDTDPWRRAAEIIDWSDPGGSIWTRDLHDARKRPLKNSTMQRIAEGIRRHCDDRLKPFADVLEELGREDVRKLREAVVPIEDARTVAETIDRPFLVECPAANLPVLTIPYLVKYYGTSTTRPPDEPLDTVTADGNHHAISTTGAFCLRQQSGGVPAGVDGPLPTVSTRGAIGLATSSARPLVMPRNGAHRGLHSNPLYRPEDRPLHTATAHNTDGYLVTPYLCPLYHERQGQRPRTRRVDRPLMTVPASKSPAGIASPFLVKYYGESTSESLAGPIGALTTRDRYALCVPECWPWGLDVRYRMLQPRELKQAQGFPEDYEIVGNKRETTKQIGNAVPVNLARALVEELLVGGEASLHTFADDPQPVSADGGGTADD